jgi:hypothetical protein
MNPDWNSMEIPQGWPFDQWILRKTDFSEGRAIPHQGQSRFSSLKKSLALLSSMRNLKSNRERRKDPHTKVFGYVQWAMLMGSFSCFLLFWPNLPVGSMMYAFSRS